MLIPETPHLRLAPPPNLPADQIERVEKILNQVLTYLRSRSRKLIPEDDLALTYDLREERR